MAGKMLKTLLATLLVGMGLVAAFAATASAETPPPDVSIVSAQASSNVDAKVNFAHIGTWVMHTQGLRRKKGRLVGCEWRSGTWTNTVRKGGIKRYRETSRAKFCPLRKPVRVGGVTFTHVKVAGGKTGTKCFNLAIPPGKKQPKPQLKGPVLDVRVLKNVKIPVQVNAFASASVTGEKQCPGGKVAGSASGTASASGTIKFTLSESLILSNRGRTSGAVNAFINQQIKVMVEAKAAANAFANIRIECGPAVQPPVQPPVVPPTQPPVQPPPTQPVNRPPTGVLRVPQHVFVNGVANVCVDGVSDPDGDPVSVSFSFTAGQAISSVFTQPGGAMCVQYRAPSTPQQVTVTATLSDGRGGTLTRLDNFPVVPDQFPDG